MKILLKSVLLLLLFSVSFTLPIVAQSSGCNSVGGLNGFLPEATSRSTGALSFTAGESIQASGVLDDNSAMSAQLTVNGAGAGSSYTIPADGNYTIGVTNASFMDGTVTVSCSSGGGAVITWSGYSDGRLSPNPAEAFAIYCENNELIIYQIFSDIGNLTDRFSIFALEDMTINQFTVYQSGTSITRVSQDSFSFRMTNGIKSISLSECFTRAGAGIPHDAPSAPAVDTQNTINIVTCPTVFEWGRDDCPDEDGDLVYDIYDNCPGVTGHPTGQGCPDNDLDGIVNTQDWCPQINTARESEALGEEIADFNGCPDYDGDDHVQSPRAIDYDECPAC